MIVILADDLTGANDTAVQFATAGYDTRLVLGPTEVDQSAEVYALTADNRQLTGQAAYEAARETLLPFASVLKRLYIKIDSTMRGPVAAHIAGAMSVWELCPKSHGDLDADREQNEFTRYAEGKEEVEARSAEHGSIVSPCQHGKTSDFDKDRSSSMALVCPAYPEMGRQVVDQIVLVDGVPLAQTAFANDPVTTITTSNIVEMLENVRPEAPEVCKTQHSGANRKINVVPLQSHGDWVRTLSEAVADGVRMATADTVQMATADAATHEDLVELADALAQFPQIVPVGSAGLARECARVWADGRAAGGSGPGESQAPDIATKHHPTVVLISSCHPASEAQLDAFLATKPPRTLLLAPDLETVANPNTLTEWAENQTGRITNVDTIIVQRPSERASDPQIATEVALHLAGITASLARHYEAGALILVGGDGARATLASLGVKELAVVDSVAEGMPAAIARDGLPGTLVVTKAGGFGSADALTAMVIHCQPPRRNHD